MAASPSRAIQERIDRDRRDGAAVLEAAAYRRLMSLWPTGVSVITAIGPEGPTGCTINAMTSLSLEPLQLLACFDLSSDTLGAIRHACRFAINVLAHDQIDIARRFALKGCVRAKVDVLERSLLEGVPVLPGCVAYFVCDLVEELAGGDHAIVIGAPRIGVADRAAEPLLFLQNSYWLPARQVSLPAQAHTRAH